MELGEYDYRMIIFAPFSHMTAATFTSLKKYAPQAQLAYTGVDHWTYWRELKKRWNTGEDLVIIEHDIEIDEKVIPSFAECKNEWCTFRYEPRIEGRSVRGIAAPAYWEHSIGCVRFSAALQARTDILKCLEKHNTHDPDLISYIDIDNHVYHALAAVQANHHCHGTVAHWHPAADGTWVVGDPMPAIVEDPIALWNWPGEKFLPLWEAPK